MVVIVAVFDFDFAIARINTMPTATPKSDRVGTATKCRRAPPLAGQKYIPRAAFSGVPQNRQSTFSDGAGCADASDASAADYGTVDKG